MPSNWTDDELRLAIMLGLRKGLSLVGGPRRTFNEDEQRRIARAILDHLRLSNYVIKPGPQRGSAQFTPPSTDPDAHD
jgi:hypothetical protein